MKRFISLRNDNKPKKKSGKMDKFITELNRNRNNALCNINDESFDIRRVVFVSLTGLYKTWRKCPSHVLYSAILIMPLQRKWIYNCFKYRKEWSQFLSINNIDLKGESVERIEFFQFLDLLQWKDSQELIFFMVCDCIHHNDSDNELTAPFWSNLSLQLTKLYDPITRGKYMPLQRDKWWKSTPFESQFDVKVASVLAELYFVTMKFKAIQEIMYQSNPLSLNVIRFYGQKYNKFICKSFDDESFQISENDNDADWYISVDYDPMDPNP